MSPVTLQGWRLKLWFLFGWGFFPSFLQTSEVLSSTSRMSHIVTQDFRTCHLSLFALQSLPPSQYVLFKSWSWEGAGLVTPCVGNSYGGAARCRKSVAFLVNPVVKAKQRFWSFCWEGEVSIWYCTHQYHSMVLNPHKKMAPVSWVF